MPSTPKDTCGRNVSSSIIDNAYPELRLSIDEGIFCGVSSGGAVGGALRVAKQNPGAVIVTILCDRRDRSLSTGLFN